MNIFYYSVHHILEDDEVRLFQNLGHDVFCLGINRPSGPTQSFRPPIDFGPQERLIYSNYELQGGKYLSGSNKDEELPYGFMGNFSIAVVMHDAGFILRQWDKLRTLPVIWRTIGQGVENFEEMLRVARNEGLNIIRYSPVELNLPSSLGQEDVIRFCKSPEQHRGWNGHDASVLTFSNFFEERYPAEAADYREIVNGFKAILGGGGNDRLPSSVGLVDHREQLRLFRDCRVYLYPNGFNIPYTLNFIEAWITGIPVVVYAPLERINKHFEIDRLVEHGVTGFVCRSVESARFWIGRLLEDFDLAERIGAAGRRAAITNFGPEKIGDQWQALFRSRARQL